MSNPLNLEELVYLAIDAHEAAYNDGIVMLVKVGGQHYRIVTVAEAVDKEDVAKVTRDMMGTKDGQIH